jgi:hypothetical protein
MSVHARRCEGCGGPLPEAPATATTITCQFCGVVHEISLTRPIPTPVAARPPAQRYERSGSIWPILILFGILLLMFILGVLAFQRLHPTLVKIDAMNRNAGRTPIAGGTVSIAELSKLAEHGYRQIIAPPPPFTGWTGFDPVAGVSWARIFANSWSPDARLTRIDLALVAADGTADLTTDATDRQEVVGYRFSSPSRIADYERIADREANAAVPYELLIRIAGKQVGVYVHSGRPPNEPLPPTLDSLPLRDIMTHAHQSGRFPDRPFYTGFLIYQQRIGWTWTFASLSGRDNIPIVRAKDAAVYPWP